MEFSIERLGFLLLVAAVVAIIARRLHVPYTVGLVAAGAAMAVTPSAPTLTMTRELIFNALLPPLIFEAAFSLHWSELKKDFWLVTTIATLGVALAVAITTLGMHVLMGWPLAAAGIFSVLISATDPVSVIATFKESGVVGRLRLLVESEALFNDGTAAVAFGLVLAATAGAAVTPGGIALQMLLSVGGGIACGAAVALAMLYLTGKTTDHLIEITFTTVSAYGAFLLAEHFHASGVLATLTAGLLTGNSKLPGAISPKSREAVEAFWEYVAFVANSLVFLLIGIHETKQNFQAVWPAALAAIAFVTLGRAAAVYPVAWLFTRTRVRISMPHQHLMFWGGLRGALALALALGLPADIPLREQIITVTFAVVAFSVIVQGLTMMPLLRHFGEVKGR